MFTFLSKTWSFFPLITVPYELEYNDWIIRFTTLKNIDEKHGSLPKIRSPFNIPKSNHRLHTELIFYNITYNELLQLDTLLYLDTLT